MRAISLVALIFAGFLVGGCSQGMKVETEFDRDANFTGLHTWDWLPGEPKPTGYRELDNPDLKARVQGAIETGFVARGCTKVSEDPDFLVAYHFVFSEEVTARNIENYYQFIHYSVFVPTVTSSYKELFDLGTLIIDVLDCRAKSFVWRGAARTKVNIQAGPRENDPKIREAVELILERFPPKK